MSTNPYFATVSEWFVERRYLFLFGLVQCYDATAFGHYRRRLRYTNNVEHLFWTRKQAQARADELNAITANQQRHIANAS